MRSALLRKSLTDLTRRKARAGFAITTLALAVASIGLFALPPLADRAMQDEVAANELADLTVSTRTLLLDEDDLAALTRLPNVEALEAHNEFWTKIYVGDRRAEAIVIGVRDFDEQTVDVVRVASGEFPQVGEVLTDVQNSRKSLFGGRTGETVRIITSTGAVRRLPISGEGRNLNGGQEAAIEGTIVLYAPADTVYTLSHSRGYSDFLFRLRDTSEPAVASTLEAVRRSLRSAPGFAGFESVPEVRPPGEWPGKAVFEDISTMFYVITILALVSALVLISNTMTTLVAEQTSEIGVMKAIGGRRRQITRVYLKTALLLGAVGSVAGVLLGVVLANLLVGYFGSEFFGIDAPWGIDVSVVVVSLVVGLLGPPLASLPAIRRGVRVPVRDALEATGSTIGGLGRVDRALRHVRWLPGNAQIGLRSAARRKRRSLATALQVSLAVGILLSVLGLTAGVVKTVHDEWGTRHWDVSIGSSLFDARADRIIGETPGVAVAEPTMDQHIVFGGNEAYAYGVRPETMFEYRLTDGRWYTAAEEQSRAPVVVVSRNIAKLTGTEVGDRVHVETAAGRLAFDVIGIVSNQQENGTVLFVPLDTLRTVLGLDGATDYWIRFTSQDREFIDRTTTLVEDRLIARGYDVGSEITYVGMEENDAQNRAIFLPIMLIGLLVVALSMVGLANAMTMSVIERTREIGVLRSIGARSRDIRRIFSAEAAVLAVAGWLAGIPVGYALTAFLAWLIERLIHVEIPVVFPPWNVLFALVGALVLALLIVRIPLRRAVRLQPGKAIRYA